MPESQGQKATLQGWEYAEGMVHGFADNVRAYWRMWGPLGEPMVHAVDFWADLQRGYLRWLREASAAGGEGMAQRGTKEAERSFRRSIMQRLETRIRGRRGALGSSSSGTEESSSEDLRSTIRESVR